MIRKVLITAIGAVLLMAGCATIGSRNNTVTIVVKKDDTLNSIAKTYDTDWHVIASMNRSELSQGLREGQQLVIKPGPASIISVTKDQVDDQVADDEDAADEDLAFLPRRKKGLLYGPRSTEPGQLIFPVEGGISSRFGKRGRKHHKGIDIIANVGTPIVASGDGEVIFSGRQRGYGSTVVVDHGQFMTLYAHASKLIARTGDRVRQGDFIAKVGRTGNARGAHLHFELRNSDNKPIDPVPYLHHKSIAQTKSFHPVKMVSSSRKVAKKGSSRHVKAKRSKKGLLYAKD